MVPFRVSCETCQATLRIRDERVVGEVHACPRCGGMVLIAAPPSAALATQMPASPESASPEPASPEVDADPQSVAAEVGPATFDQFDPDLISQETGLSQKAGLSQEAGNAEPDTLVDSEAETFDATALETLPNEGAGRLLGMLLGAGGLGVFAVTGLLFYLSGPAEKTDSAAATSEATYTGGGDASAENRPEPIKNASEETPPETASEEALSATEPDGTEIGNSAVAPELETPEPKEPAPKEPAPREPAPEKPVPDKPLPNKPATVGSAAIAALPEQEPQEPETNSEIEPNEQAVSSQPEARSGFDPLDLDPLSMDLILTKKPAEPEAAEPTQAKAPPKPQLRIASATPLPAKNLDERLSVRVAQEGVTIERREVTGMVDNSATVDERLKQSVASLALADRPLLDTLRLLGKIGGVAVTVDPVTLSQAAIGPETKVSLRKANQTVGGLFADLLRPKRLEPLATATGVVVRRQGVEREKSVSYPVADLLQSGQTGRGQTDKDDAEAIALLIRQFASPRVWEGVARIEAEGTNLAVDGPATAHFEVLLLLERLRKAAKLPQRTRYPQQRLRIEPPLVALDEILRDRTTFTFIDDTPLEELFQHWREELKVEVLVDWQALAEQQLRPESKVACSVRDQPWQKTLTLMLEGLGLAWEAADARVLFVTSRPVSRERFATEFYRLPTRTADGTNIANELRATLNKSDDPRAAVAYEPRSQRLLVGGNHQTHQQAWNWLSERATDR